MEAQRYPEDYDGIIAGDPANNWTRFYAGGHLWYWLATTKDPASYIPASKVPLLNDAVNAACDAHRRRQGRRARGSAHVQVRSGDAGVPARPGSRTLLHAAAGARGPGHLARRAVLRRVR